MKKSPRELAPQKLLKVETMFTNARNALKNGKKIRGKTDKIILYSRQYRYGLKQEEYKLICEPACGSVYRILGINPWDYKPITERAKQLMRALAEDFYPEDVTKQIRLF